jgi:CMP/dCMP kinase
MSNKFTIAISGKSGCGNSTVSKLLSQRLGFKMVNFTFRQLADEKGLSFDQLRALAEESDEIDRELDRRQVEMASQESSVLSSRLAIWMLEDANLTVYLYASLEERTRRIWKREGGSYEKKREETIERDRKDHRRYKRIYGIDSDDYHFVDLLIDTEKHTPEEIAEIIAQKALHMQRV